MMQNVQSVDPTNKFAKESKKVSSKRKKTDADHERLKEIDFFGGLYMNENGPCIPSNWIEGTIIAGAKKEREGPRAKSGFYCEGSFDLEYEGPRTAEELWEEKDKFVDVRPVNIQRNKVMKCRPIFKEWSAEIEVSYDNSAVNPEELKRWLDVAGSQCGIGTYRPKHGRFHVEILDNK